MSNVAYSDRDNFIRNMVTIRCGGRLFQPPIRRLGSSSQSDLGGMPLTVDEVAEDLRFDAPEDEYATIERAMRGAAAFLERRTAYVIIPTEYEVLAPSWGAVSHWMDIDRAPLRQIDEVSYLSAADTWTPIDPGEYWATRRERSFTIRLVSTFDRPELWDEASEDGIRVRFTAGYDPARTGMDLPIDEGLQSLWVMLTGHFLKNRELARDDIERGANALLGAYRQLW